MSRENEFEVANSFRKREIGAGDRMLINAFGAGVVVDFWTQLALSGYLYHIQIGTENAPVASTTGIDDELAWMLADTTAGITIPALYEVNVATWTTATLVEAMLEVDNAQNRFSSGGTPFTPEPLNNRNYFAASVNGYVGTDIALGSKTAVPGSVELARRVFSEDAVATPTPADFADPVVYSAHSRPLSVSQGVSALVGHHGAVTADVTSYGVLQFANFPAELVPSA